jgi:hypothetical protein
MANTEVPDRGNSLHIWIVDVNILNMQFWLGAWGLTTLTVNKTGKMYSLE